MLGDVQERRRCQARRSRGTKATSQQAWERGGLSPTRQRGKLRQSVVRVRTRWFGGCVPKTPVPCPESAGCHRGASSCLRPAGLPHGATSLPGFGTEELCQTRQKREKKNECPCWQPSQPKGEDLGQRRRVLSRFLPAASCNHRSEGLRRPRMLQCAGSLRNGPTALGAAHQDSPKRLWGEVPHDPEALSIMRSHGAATATSCPRSPSPFGTRGHPPPSPGSPDRAFCRWTAGSGCMGCRSTSLPAQRGEDQD